MKYENQNRGFRFLVIISLTTIAAAAILTYILSHK